MPVLEAFRSIQQKWPQALLILAPRKPERFAAAGEIVAQAGWHAIRRSGISLDGPLPGILGNAANADHSVLLLDTLGELASVYAIADAVFIVWLLVPCGGYNLLDPSVLATLPLMRTRIH